MTASTQESYPWRLQLPIYASGFFNGNVYFLTGILMPLWAAITVREPVLIGLVVAARQILPVMLSIHGGALMDRFGPRRIMLIFGAVGMISAACFPFFPFLSAIIALQMLSGLAESLGWIGSQTLVGQIMKGHATYTGRLSLALRLGGFLGPWLAGIAWHRYGPQAGFFFISAWIGMGWIAGWLVPVKPDSVPGALGRVSIAELLPRWSDYAAAFRMIGISSIGLVIAVTIMRQTGSGIQLSFYPVWLSQLGVTAADIGFMVGCSHIASASSSLSVGFFSRWIGRHWLLIVSIGISIATIAVTPMLAPIVAEAPGIGKIYVIFLGVLLLRGFSQGLNMPLMMSIGMQAVSAHEQGKVVGLRITVNRLTSALVPLIMGAIAQWFSLKIGFYLIGGTGLVGLALTALWLARSPSFRKK